MGSLWSFLAKPKNQKTLSWIGGGAVIAIAGLWAAFVYFFPPKNDAHGEPPTSGVVIQHTEGTGSPAQNGNGNTVINGRP